MENCGCLHSNGEKSLYSFRKLLKKGKKMIRLSFGKKKKPRPISPKTTMEKHGNYVVYKNEILKRWKTRWKKWKTSWETPLLFHKFGGKPGGKSG